MNEQQYLDFISALGEEFSTSLSPVVGWDNITPHDCYEVLHRVLKESLSPESLASLTEQNLGQISAAFEAYFECENIPVALLRHAVSRTLARWPPDGSMPH